MLRFWLFFFLKKCKDAPQGCLHIFTWAEVYVLGQAHIPEYPTRGCFMMQVTGMEFKCAARVKHN